MKVWKLLNKSERIKVLTDMLDRGYSVTQIANILKCTRSSVYAFMKNNYIPTPYFSKPGRPGGNTAPYNTDKTTPILENRGDYVGCLSSAGFREMATYEVTISRTFSMVGRSLSEIYQSVSNILNPNETIIKIV